MNSEIDNPSLIYNDQEPNIGVLAQAYDRARLELEEYYFACSRSYDDRRNLWSGKSEDLRKHGANAFPWEGASDQEVNVVGERVDTYVALCSMASQRSHIKAFPLSVAAVAKAATTSLFLKFMRSSYIEGFAEHMELGCNYLFEKSLQVTYVGWKKEKNSFLQTLSLDEIAQAAPEVAQMIVDGQNDEEIAQTISDAFGATMGRAKKAVRQLRSNGQAELPTSSVAVDRPYVHACAPDGEFTMPSYTSDFQKVPYCFWRQFMTSEELLQKVETEGWDKDWVDMAIERLRGIDSYVMDSEYGNRDRTINQIQIYDTKDLVMVVNAYQRLIDPVDGSVGIYRTVFHPTVTDSYAIKELLNGVQKYPFVVTPISRSEKRLYETQPMTKTLRGPQIQIKVERDTRIDRASLATMPPIMHPAGRPPTDWGPGRKVPYRRLGEISFGPTPGFDPGSIEIENSMRVQADKAVGLDMDNPLAGSRQQFFVNKHLSHQAEVLSMALDLYWRMGPEEVFFQVSGSADPQTMTKGGPNDKYQIMVAFDTQNSDPETAEARIAQMTSLVQMDRNGIINVNKLLEFAAMSIDPVLADYVFQPQEVAQDKMLKDVTDDLSKIYAGIEVPARPNGADMTLQIAQSYAQQPDVSQRLQSDEAFRERLQKYIDQNLFVLQQAENAQTGRIGTAPATMGGTQTQNMEQ